MPAVPICPPRISASLVAALLVIITATSTHAEAISFENAPLLSHVGRDIEIVDLNTDGHLDLVAVNVKIVVRLGKGDGDFCDPVPVASADFAKAIEVADMDGDGTLDLVTLEQDGFSVYAGDGEGNFTLLGTRTTGITAGDLLVEDLNGDGRGDVIVFVAARRGRWDYWVDAFVSTPDGRLQRRFPIRLQGSPVAATLTQLDDDGIPDLLLTASDNRQKVHVLRGDGTGRFIPSAAQSFVLEHAVQSIHASDVDGDGKVEVITAGGSVAISEVGTQTPPSSVYLRTRRVGSVTSIDADGDGDQDIAASRLDDGIVYYLQNDGNGAFRIRGSRQGTPSHSFPAPLATGDIDGDGLQDLAQGGHGTRMLLGHQRNGLTSPRALPLGQLGEIQAHGDFDGDGRIDLIGTLGHEDGVFFIRSASRRSALSPIAEISIATRRIAAGDFDGDGALDVAAASQDGLRFLRGSGDGRFGTPRSMEIGWVGTLLATDLNDDGLDDLVTRTYQPNVLQTWISNGQTFVQTGEYALSLQPTDPIQDIGIGDFDGDGAPDIAYTVTLLGASGIRLLYGDGTGSFAEELLVSTSWPWEIAVGDLDSDGRDDLVFRGEGLAKGEPFAQILISATRRGFRHGDRLEGFLRPLLISDLDADGFGEIIGDTGSSVAVFRGNAQASFGTKSETCSGGRVNHVVAHDLNGDMRTDLILSNVESGSIVVARGLDNSN